MPYVKVDVFIIFHVLKLAWSSHMSYVKAGEGQWFNHNSRTWQGRLDNRPGEKWQGGESEKLTLLLKRGGER